MPTMERSIRLRDGRTLAYAEYGTPHGAPVIYCHGSPSSRVECELSLHTTAADLGLRVIAPDRPGMGGSDFQAGRRIIDWPSDVLELAVALGLDRFTVLGSSGGSAYAAACGALIPERVRAIGLIGGIAPLDAPGASASLNPMLRIMLRLGRYAPLLLRGLFRMNLKMMSNGRDRAIEQMATRLPEPDRSLLRQRPDVGRKFMACFEESCRHGVKGPAWDVGVLARPWGFDLRTVGVPVMLWHGERDGNVPVLHGRYLARVIPGCRATFFPDDAHLTLFVNHYREILGSLTARATAA